MMSMEQQGMLIRTPRHPSSFRHQLLTRVSILGSGITSALFVGCENSSPTPPKALAMSVQMRFALCATLLLCAAGGCSVKQKVRTVWAIEAGSKVHSVDARSLTAMSDGSFVVVGGETLQNLRAWAARAESSGQVRWEFLDKAGSDPRDNRFFDAVELPGGLTMLCGVKTIDSKPTAFIDRVNDKGELLDEHSFKPVEEGYAGSIQCFRWGDGVALSIGIGRTLRATGWLIKVDIEGKVQWDRFGDLYRAVDGIVTSEDQLWLLSNEGNGLALKTFDTEGNLLRQSTIAVPDGALRLVHAITPKQKQISQIVVTTDEESILLTFTADSPNQPHTTSLKNVFAHKAYELTDGTVAIFGNERRRGATANITRMFKGDKWRSYVFEPLYASQWIVDAAPANGPNEFVTIRQIGPNSVISRIVLE
jgi:hypothetical protein